MKKTAIMLTAMFVLSGCSLFATEGGSNGESAMSGGNAEVEAIISSAEGALKKASSVGGEWRDSKKKYIKSAKAALSKGDVKKAMKLAKKAKFEAEMGYQQAMEQQKAGPWLF